MTLFGEKDYWTEVEEELERESLERERRALFEKLENDFEAKIQQTTFDKKSAGLFFSFIKEIAEIPGMPPEVWPKACLYAGLLTDALDEDMEAERKKSSQRALDSRYEKRRELLEKAGRVAQHLWEEGSTLLHHEMKKYLVEDYKDEQGKYIFASSLPDKSILEKCKQVAQEMNRTDLVSGRKVKK